VLFDEEGMRTRQKEREDAEKSRLEGEGWEVAGWPVPIWKKREPTMDSS